MTTPRSSSPRCSAGLLALALLAACDPQAEPAYLGEPLLTLSGAIGGSVGLAPAEAALLWEKGPPPLAASLELAARAPLDGPAPAGAAAGTASFVLRLYQPPPASDLQQLTPGGVRFAWASLAVLPRGLPAAAVGQAAAGGLASGFGVDAEHWVIFLEQAVAAGTAGAWRTGGPLQAGYSVLRVRWGCRSAAELEGCLAELVALGIPDDGTSAPGTAGGYCREPYRLSPAPAGEPVVLSPGGPAGGGEVCP